MSDFVRSQLGVGKTVHCLIVITFLLMNTKGHTQREDVNIFDYISTEQSSTRDERKSCHNDNILDTYLRKTRSLVHRRSSTFVRGVAVGNSIFLENKRQKFNTAKIVKRTADFSCSHLAPCSKNNIPRCYSDMYCLYFGDCCRNYNISEQSSQHSFVHSPTCQVLFSTNMPPYGLKHLIGVWLITKCPPDFILTKVKEKCENLTLIDKDQLNIIPVTAKNGLTFSNVYCGICNQVYDYHPWPITTTTSGLISDANYTDFYNSRIRGNMFYMLSKKFAPRFCLKSIENRTECPNFQEPVHFKGSIYKNYHCLPAANTKFDCPMYQKLCSPVCVDCIYYDMFDTIPLFLRWTKELLTFSFADHFRMEKSRDKCNDNDILDGDIKCVKLGCLNGVTEWNSTCATVRRYYTNRVITVQWYYDIVTDSVSDTYIKHVTETYFEIVRYFISLHGLLCLHMQAKEGILAKPQNQIYLLEMFLLYNKTVDVTELREVLNWIENVQMRYSEVNPISQQKFIIGRSKKQENVQWGPIKEYIRCYVHERKESINIMRSIVQNKNASLLLNRCRHFYLVEELNRKEKDYFQKMKTRYISCNSARAKHFVCVILITFLVVMKQYFRS